MGRCELSPVMLSLYFETPFPLNNATESLPLALQQPNGTKTPGPSSRSSPERVLKLESISKVRFSSLEKEKKKVREEMGGSQHPPQKP